MRIFRTLAQLFCASRGHVKQETILPVDDHHEISCVACTSCSKPLSVVAR
ncbi:hypothetical protein [Actinoplanes sp. N902-109]|nr:hypothetical protein [Actinoplanes sp. N902-109]AGL13845.1 hypothetical protein L083_0335 [Actinoplanes sp. N902-109]